MPPFVRIERRGPVTWITLDRPDTLNALHPPLYRALVAACDAFLDDPAQRVCVLTGSGRGFCSGVDLKYAAAAKAAWRTVSDEFNGAGRLALLERHDIDKPFIAAVNGLAMGGGFELALACDLIVAADTAQFALSEPRVGAIAQGGGPHRLARQIGLKPAMGMILTGRRVSAAEGMRLGFVNEVVTAAELDAAASRWAADIAACGPLAIRAAKEMTLRGLEEPGLAQALRNQSGYPAFERWAASDEALEGARAFAEKRRPHWQDPE